MNIKQSIFSVVLVIFITNVAQGNEVKTMELSAQKLLNPRAELFLPKKTWEASLNDLTSCSGSEFQVLPVIGKCPAIPGYYAIGFPPCTQEYSVPNKLTVEEISNGFVKLICEQDLANASIVGPPSCDFSDCIYVEEPIFP